MTRIEKEIVSVVSVLGLVVLKINKYLDGRLNISDLIYDLESCLNQLALADEKWKKILELYG
jgi:hypothetical protein